MGTTLWCHVLEHPAFGGSLLSSGGGGGHRDEFLIQQDHDFACGNDHLPASVSWGEGGNRTAHDRQA